MERAAVDMAAVVPGRRLVVVAMALQILAAVVAAQTRHLRAALVALALLSCVIQIRIQMQHPQLVRPLI